MRRLNISIEELIEKSLKDLVSALTTDEACGKLIFPCYRDGNIRHSEQELRQIFLKNVEKDTKKAHDVIEHDDIVDKLFDEAKKDVIRLIIESSDDGEDATDLLMIAKYFERIGDHATNIAEWVIFSLKTED